MKTNPQRYLDTLSLAPRLAPVVPDASTLRYHRRVHAGVRAYFAMGEREWIAELSERRPIKRRDQVN
jgi:hypothetical protein